MMQKKMITKLTAGLMAAVILFTSIAAQGMAADTNGQTGEGKAEYADTLPLFMEVADQLDPGEAVTAEDIEITAGDAFDPAEDFTSISYDEGKVTVHFSRAEDADGKEFSNKKAGVYTATYYAEPLSSHHDYRFTRKVTVKEKANSSGGSETAAGKDHKDDGGKATVKEDEEAGSEDGTGSSEHSGSKGTAESSSATEAEKEAASTEADDQTASGQDTADDPAAEQGTLSDPSAEDTSEENADAAALEESAVSAGKADQLSYNILYVRKHGNKAYIDLESLDYSSMVFPVTVVRGLATYNVRKQKEFEVTGNFIAGMTYSLPVYDVDGKSDYYVAMPDVNLFSKELASYDITVIYNNDYAEKIDGYHYEKKILYIPKSVIDDPKNENPLYEGGPLAVQLNYAFGGLDTDQEGNAGFGKTLPVQILNSKKEAPENKSVKIENIFEDSVTIPGVVSSKDGYKKDDFKIFLNGMTVPIAEDAWGYEDGDVVIYSSPAIISNINILYEGKGLVAKALSVLDHLLSLQVNAASDGSATNTGDMKFYKSITGKNVVLELDPDSMYVGWRGVFTSNVLFAPHGPNYDNGHKMGNYNTIMNWKKNNTHPDTYDELFNSASYLYGGYTPHDTDTEKQYWNWALESYTVGKNKANDASDALSRDTKIEANEGSGMANRTIYEWFIAAQKKLEKAVSYFGAGTDWAEEKWGSDSYVSVGGVEQNGIGGDTNFAFKIPKNSTISGSDKNLVSDKDSAGYGSGNPDIKFTFSNFPDDSIYLAAGCTHFDELASGGTDDNGNDEDTIYVSCLDYKPDDGYIVLAFTTSGQQGYTHMQEAVAVYKFKVEPKYPVRLKKVSSLTAMTSDNAVYADLSGAKYGIYESKANAEEGKDAIATLTSKADGTTNEVSLPKGSYYVKELTAPKNYAVDSETLKVTVTGSSTVQTFTMSDPPQNNPLNLVLVKIEKETGKAEPQGEGALAGAEFTVKYFDNESGTTSGTAKKTWVFKTDAKGEVHLKDSYKVSGDGLYKNTAGNETLPVGTYSVQETKAPAGYLIVDSSAAMQVVKASGKAETFTAFVTKNVPNQIIRGGIQIKKEDTITGGTPQGDGDLSGITFEITNESTHSVRVDGKDYAKGAVVKSIVTDAKGIAKTGNKDLPYGNYSIKEVKTNASYLLTDGKAKSFQIREDGKTVEISEAFKDEVVRGDVEIEKMDKETDVRVPLGSATHVGTTFEITNKSVHPVVVDGKLFQAGEVCKTIRIEKEKETAKTTGRALPYGTYTIKEVAVGTGYLLTDTKERTFQIREDGKTVSISKDGDVKEPFRNQVKRGDFNFIKVFEDADSDRNMNSLANIPFEVISKTTGEKHIIVTDENGQFDSDNGWFAHSKNTNANDAAVDADGKVDETKLTSEAGVWFDTDREGNKAKKVDDSLGALPYDTYVLNELSCKANEGAKLIKNREFTIRVDKRDISLGTIDDPSDKQIGTVAADGLTKDHFGSNASKSIIDTVTYKGLTKGQTYTMKGTLIDKATEEPVMVEGKKVTAKESFTAEDASGTVTITFTFPEEALKGKEVVAFETCETNGKVIASHEDIEDADQTVVYPEIGTEAKDGQTENHFGLNDSTSIKDSVKYMNLKPGKEYTMTGTLMDKATGKAITDADGKEITASHKFTPEKKDGEVTLTFEIPAGLLTGKSVVAFERCSREKTEIAVHTDIEDEDQTVHYPDIGTEAKDDLSKTHYGFAGSTKVIDTVSFVNLEPGKDYIMKGRLMDKATGKALVDADGKEITAEQNFTPAEKDGQVQMTFEVPAGLLAAKTVVAFETCFQEEKEIAAHADIEDEGQTVHYPEIGTKAKDSQSQTHHGVDASTRLVDTVSFKNLEPEKEYTMTGTLMDKATGKAIQDKDGVALTAHKKFKPEKKDGTVEIVFDFPTGLLAGKTVVAFESCSREEKEVAVHADIEDENQTVHYPKIGTTLTDDKTKDHIVAAGKETTLTDLVSYQNLESGKEHTLSGRLMDKKTGKAVTLHGKAVTASVKFTPKDADGTVKLQFKVSADSLKGTSLVAFERVVIVEKGTEITVASHEDLKDAAQTVTVPKIATNAKDQGTKSHNGKVSKTVTIEDTVTYSNLIPGKEYTMTGTLMDKSTGKALTGADGKKITVSKKFTAGKTNGSVVITFKVPGELVKEKKVVAFESCTYKGIEVAVHADLSDKDQTVEYPKDETPDKPSGSTPSKKEKTTSRVSTSPKTGDNNNLALWIGIALVSVAGLAGSAYLFFRNRKKKKKILY
ncbi:MAG: VaFE repeat-containing surface-anchored protein [Oscillospiraceae bacterium]|nr:VaFE repeat-containing surface-anchored protein [Oscillospiraceae bacterium]